ncbi:hypothetical protein ATY77_01880 [Rhizobium sp. R634]|uniref:DUF6030 family protein n=1 Tax=Rhizobium sp. R634 TaxID=1764274 RepID=UPI000B52EB97|nr:DUF6030 family protein [Rhizobium sp. R634]OWV82017.1 hypothetical protein ATY77_01880 [Rhizobium sp. R634]
MIAVLLLAGIAVFYREIRQPEAPVERFDHLALDKAGRLSDVAASSHAAAPSALPSISISRHLIAFPRLDLASQFLRRWLVSGENLCGALREAGIEVSEWKAASMRNRNYECYFQRIDERDEVRPLSSTFLRVRGNEIGDILEVRAKIVGPKTDAEGRLASAALRIFEIIVKQACWRDFEDTLVSIQRLRDVEDERFGAYLSFTREAGSENSFNFALGLRAASDPQVRTKTYFSTDRWLTSTNPPSNRVDTSTSANCAHRAAAP